MGSGRFWRQSSLVQVMATSKPSRGEREALVSLLKLPHVKKRLLPTWVMLAPVICWGKTWTCCHNKAYCHGLGSVGWPLAMFCCSEPSERTSFLPFAHCEDDQSSSVLLENITGWNSSGLGLSSSENVRIQGVSGTVGLIFRQISEPVWSIVLEFLHVCLLFPKCFCSCFSAVLWLDTYHSIALRKNACLWAQTLLFTTC